MSCGKPIACSRVCDNTYIVKEGENALMFDNTNVKDIADKLEQICSMSKDDLCKWGHRSREIAEEILSMDAFVNKYIKLIEQ
jgi:glycosyltransferase involved in cell wall biosynthesis